MAGKITRHADQFMQRGYQMTEEGEGILPAGVDKGGSSEEVELSLEERRQAKIKRKLSGEGSSRRERRDIKLVWR